MAAAADASTDSALHIHLRAFKMRDAPPNPNLPLPNAVARQAFEERNTWWCEASGTLERRPSVTKYEGRTAFVLVHSDPQGDTRTEAFPAKALVVCKWTMGSVTLYSSHWTSYETAQVEPCPKDEVTGLVCVPTRAPGQCSPAVAEEVARLPPKLWKQLGRTGDTSQPILLLQLLRKKAIDDTVLRDDVTGEVYVYRLGRVMALMPV